MAAHIRLKSYLGFGRFRYMTGAQLLQHEGGVSYLRWAHHKGMVIDPEILFQIGLHHSQTHPAKPPKLIPLTPELIAEAQAHEDQLNGVTHDEETNTESKEHVKPCDNCSNPRDVRGDCERCKFDGEYWALYC